MRAYRTHSTSGLEVSRGLRLAFYDFFKISISQNEIFCNTEHRSSEEHISSNLTVTYPTNNIRI